MSTFEHRSILLCEFPQIYGNRYSHDGVPLVVANRLFSPINLLRWWKYPHCLHLLQSPALANQFKPAILQCFGDIAGAIGGHFETYLSVVAQVLQQAAGVQASTYRLFDASGLTCPIRRLATDIELLGPDGSYEMFDYVVSLREGIVDAWGGIIGAMKASEKSESPSVSNTEIRF